MTTAQLNNTSIEDGSSHKLWRVFLFVSVLHFLIIAIIHYEFPTLQKKKLSDITIELGGILIRGTGGDGIPQAINTKKQQEAKKSSVKDDLSTKKATQSEASALAQAPTSSAPAGVESAPTIDADYKAAYLNNPKPPYPSVAFQMRIQGTVMLKALVLPDGTCGDVVLARSSGNSFLDESALKTVAQWKFTPAKSQGKDVSQWVSIPITFSIKRN